MIEEHVAHVKARFGAPVYVSKRGDILVDAHAPIVATAREIAMNSGKHMQSLWAVRCAHARGKAADFLRAGDWKAA